MKKKKTPKQIAALVCVVLLVLLYAVTLIVAILDFPGANRLFQFCLYATVGLPILLWVYIWLYGIITARHTIASFSPDESEAAPDAPSKVQNKTKK